MAMDDDGIAATEIARQIAALKPRVQGYRGVMGYLDKPQSDKRADVNKTFLASTLRGVDTHNRRQEEDKCWTLRQMEHKVHESRDRRRSSLKSNDRNSNRIKRERSLERSRSRSRSRRFRRSQSRCRRSSSQASRNRSVRRNEKDERIYWARKKADKTRKLWENLHSEGTVLVENAPDYSFDESNDDIKPGKRKSSSFPNGKKHKVMQHRQKSDKTMKRR